MIDLQSVDVVESFARKKVLVVGDVMLDEYVWGDARRISPEAPVPVVEVTRRSFSPGGAANTVANVAALRGDPWLVGVVGDDPQGERLKSVLLDRGVASDGIVVDSTRPTTSKVRIIAHHHQIARMDTESRSAVSSLVSRGLIHAIQGRLPSSDACILSDYAKGVVSAELAETLIREAATRGIPVVVDPKGSDFRRYAGATIITPNIHETERALQREITTTDELVDCGFQLAKITGAAILITRGSDGMSLFLGSRVVHIPVVAKDVYDVTGAGDTVVATLALALSARMVEEEAAWIASHAASIAVTKMGTVAVTSQELRHALQASRWQAMHASVPL